MKPSHSEEAAPMGCLIKPHGPGSALPLLSALGSLGFAQAPGRPPPAPPSTGWGEGGGNKMDSYAKLVLSVFPAEGCGFCGHD